VMTKVLKRSPPDDITDIYLYQHLLQNTLIFASRRVGFCFNITTGSLIELVKFQNALHSPQAPCCILAHPQHNRIYFTWNHLLISIDPKTNIQSILAGGVYGFGCEDGDGKTARFDRPSGMTLDHNGDLLLADYGNYRICRIVVTVHNEKDHERDDCTCVVSTECKTVGQPDKIMLSNQLPNHLIVGCIFKIELYDRTAFSFEPSKVTVFPSKTITPDWKPRDIVVGQMSGCLYAFSKPGNTIIRYNLLADVSEELTAHLPVENAVGLLVIEPNIIFVACSIGVVKFSFTSLL
jgi:hypothetical protein